MNSTPVHRTRIKFCGMTRRADLELALQLGVDAVGLIFAAKSPRRLHAEQAAELVAGLPRTALRVALFMDTSVADIETAIRAVQPDVLQFHGNEDAEVCAGYGLPYWKALPMASLPDATAFTACIARYPNAAGWVLDSHATGEAGGSGQRFNWSQPLTLERPWLLAGGLNPDNVAAAIRQLRPWGVDVSSGIEVAPGIKDTQGMRRFVAEVARADAALNESNPDE